MSKIGKAPIELPAGVTVTKEGKTVNVTGPKGSMSVDLIGSVDVQVADNEVKVTLNNESETNGYAYWGLVRALLNNAVTGVSEGFKKELELVGTGYRVEKVGNDLKIQIGYSHPVNVKAPEGITFELEGNTIIKVNGYDRQSVGQVAANIRAIRKPEPYKGKGIKYRDEIVRRKQGKAAKA